jgi:hypothetical protein
MTKKDTDQEAERATVVVDAYYIRLQGQPAELGERPPATWREVANQINGHLMRIASGLTRLLCETVEGTTRLVRGLSGIPGALARRIETAHSAAEIAEGENQRKFEADQTAAINPDVSLKEIEAILTKYRIKGYLSQVSLGRDGRPILVIARPEHENLLNELVQKSLPAGGESTGDTE